jgi:hypothetical protein
MSTYKPDEPIQLRILDRSSSPNSESNAPLRTSQCLALFVFASLPILCAAALFQRLPSLVHLDEGVLQIILGIDERGQAVPQLARGFHCRPMRSNRRPKLGDEEAYLKVIRPGDVPGDGLLRLVLQGWQVLFEATSQDLELVHGDDYPVPPMLDVIARRADETAVGSELDVPILLDVDDIEFGKVDMPQTCYPRVRLAALDQRQYG